MKAICDRYKKGIDALNSSKSEQEVEEATEQLVLTRSYDSSKRMSLIWEEKVTALNKRAHGLIPWLKDKLPQSGPFLNSKVDHFSVDINIIYIFSFNEKNWL